MSAGPVTAISSSSSIRTDSLSRLLPYDSLSGKNIQSFLKEYKFLTNVLSDCFRALQNRELQKFDCLVGENACHIRAIKIAQVVNNRLINPERASGQIAVTQQKIEDLIKSSKPLQKTTPQEALQGEELDIQLSDDEIFLVECFLLTLTKETHSSGSICLKEASNPEKLVKFGDITKSFAKKLEHHVRSLVAQSSVQYIRQCASSSEDQMLITSTSEKYTVIHNNYLSCIPLFWTFQTILQAIKKEKIFVLVHVKFIAKDQENKTVDEHYLAYDSIGNVCSMSELPKETPFFVIEGVVCTNAHELPFKNDWLKTFAEIPIADVILANTAAHRQYPDGTADTRLVELKDEKFDSYKALAQKGFSLENPSIFFINHVFAAYANSI